MVCLMMTTSYQYKFLLQGKIMEKYKGKAGRPSPLSGITGCGNKIKFL